MERIRMNKDFKNVIKEKLRCFRKKITVRIPKLCIFPSGERDWETFSHT